MAIGYTALMFIAFATAIYSRTIGEPKAILPVENASAQEILILRRVYDRASFDIFSGGETEISNLQYIAAENTNISITMYFAVCTVNFYLCIKLTRNLIFGREKFRKYPR